MRVPVNPLLAEWRIAVAKVFWDNANIPLGDISAGAIHCAVERIGFRGKGAIDRGMR
jgi:hypothetical protein